MGRRRVYSSACIGTLEKRGFQACDQGSKCRHASQTDRPEPCLKKTTTIPQSVNVNKVLYVTMPCAVSMYAMLAANGHQPVRVFDLFLGVQKTRPETARRRRDRPST